MRCVVEADPAIDVTAMGWLYGRDAFYVSTSDRYTIYFTPSTGSGHQLVSVLTINGITEHELGLYTCEARNPAGMYKRDTVELSLGT